MVCPNSNVRASWRYWLQASAVMNFHAMVEPGA
jgi:hypothetical protein